MKATSSTMNTPRSRMRDMSSTAASGDSLR
jgi:hypothetical protein